MKEVKSTNRVEQDMDRSPKKERKMNSAFAEIEKFWVKV